MKLISKIITIGKNLFSKSTNKPNKPTKKAYNKTASDNRKKNRGRKDKDFSQNRPKKTPNKRLKSPHSSDSRPKKPFKKIAPKKVPTAYDLETLKTDVAAFANLGLNEFVLSAVKDMGYNNPTSIQEQAIPSIIEGSDIIGTAQTGTGKTAAFSLPIVNMLSQKSDTPQVLVLTPTRELATQTAEAFINFSKYTPLQTVIVQGGVSIDNQINIIQNGVDIVVATPGRLLDLIRNKEISLNTIKYVVLDEVDRMFDMGFIEDVSNIIRYCPKTRQTLFFSATMPDGVMKLSKWALNNPTRLDTGIASNSPAETIEHFIYPVDGIQKYDLLIEYLKSITFESLIVFTRTRMDADRISEWLIGHNHKVSTLHSDRSQRDRDKALKDFKLRNTNILVATDIASRGLDINDVEYVINYNVPEHAEDYVHRIGRTGRANKDGTAITLYSSEETMALDKVEDFIKAKIERRKLESFAYRNEPQLSVPVKRTRKRNR